MGFVKQKPPERRLQPRLAALQELIRCALAFEYKSTDMSDALVLVTGGSGFVGSHCILQLLERGYRVRTAVRSLDREAGVRAMLKGGGDHLTFTAADLMSDKGWPEAAAGCDYVLHVASPFPLKVPKDENELILPAREGALRLLRAARDARVKRVVLTSSFAAIGYGHKPTEKPFTEADWTDPNGTDVSPYVKLQNPGRARSVGFHRS